MTGHEDSETGAAVAGFALTAGLTTLVFLIVLQFAFVLHTKAVVIDAAGQGARIAARHNASVSQGIARTAELLEPLAGTPDITTARLTVGNSQTIRVTVSTQFPVLGPFGIPGLLTAHGNALVETYDPLP